MQQRATIDGLVEDFGFLDDWEDRYRYVIELGKSLPALADREHNDANKVRGCASQVWLVSEVARNGEPVLRFRGDSDAHIVRGLIAILLRPLFRPHRARDRGDGPGSGVPADRAARPPDLAALERALLHGRAHPLRRQAALSAELT